MTPLTGRKCSIISVPRSLIAAPLFTSGWIRPPWQRYRYDTTALFPFVVERSQLFTSCIVLVPPCSPLISFVLSLQVVAAGYRAILSNYNLWYLDQLGVTWQQMYSNEPYQGITDPAQQKLILGGEVCMWGETVDASDMHNTVWPRAAAVRPLPSLPHSVVHFSYPIRNRLGGGASVVAASLSLTPQQPCRGWSGSAAC